MKIFLDTNVVMDYLASRGDVESVSKIFNQIENGVHSASISIGSFYTITYLTEIFLKSKGLEKSERIKMLRATLESLLVYINVAGHTKAQLLKGVKDIEFQDIEDSYQYQAALTAECECLITSNIKDFSELENPLIDIVLPKEFCN
ncbi:MAG: PIN domain-containing protein [Bacteroidaceae bacterium]|nr:PIN domain-containing protein [Bacteroidaceae bacterium]